MMHSFSLGLDPPKVSLWDGPPLDETVISPRTVSPETRPEFVLKNEITFPVAMSNRTTSPFVASPAQKLVPSGSRVTAKKLESPVLVYVWMTAPELFSRTTLLVSATRRSPLGLFRSSYANVPGSPPAKVESCELVQTLKRIT